MLEVDGFSIFRNDRRDDTTDHRRGGGALIYASSSVLPTSVQVYVNVINRERPHGLEYNLITFLYPQLSYLLCVYAPPNLHVDTIVAFQHYIGDIFDHLLCVTPNAEIYIAGDLNRHDFSFMSSHFNIVNILSLIHI